SRDPRACDHPDSAETREDGSFTITHGPPGTYTVNAWHEDWTVVKKGVRGKLKYGEPHTTSKQVTVKRGQSATVTFEFAAK
ncbi:MAG: hypothetical protein ACE5H5_04325, partial [Nitrospinota bacterium]